jgi:hypothetical protein
MITSVSWKKKWLDLKWKSSMPKAVTLEPLPGLPEFCEQFRTRAQDRLRPYASGRHIQLWRGHSLEFRDYAPYTPGDDIRHVDWHATYRSGKKDEWLVRRFQAEEGWNIIVSIDTRESMYLPSSLPKIHMASWAAEAVARIALRSDDKVYFHRLFGAPQPLPFFQRSSSIPRVFPTLKKLLKDSALEDSSMNLAQFRGGFFTNAALIIFSDFYFTDNPEQRTELARFIRAVEQGWRWVILVNLDSWPLETVQLTGGHSGAARRVFGPGMSETIECDTGNEVLKLVENNIKFCQKELLQAINREEFNLTWRWEQEALPNPLGFFEKCFAGKPPQKANPQNPFFQLFIPQR